jgi:hypothetical protein
MLWILGGGYVEVLIAFIAGAIVAILAGILGRKPPEGSGVNLGRISASQESVGAASTAIDNIEATIVSSQVTIEQVTSILDRAEKRARDRAESVGDP